MPKLRLNFHKGNWFIFTKTLNDSVQWIPLCIDNYECFTKFVICTTKSLFLMVIKEATFLDGMMKHYTSLSNFRVIIN